MELNEAIAHAKEVAKDRNETANNTPTEYGDYINSCRECAKEHEQLANWLEELQERREADRWIPVSERLPEDFCVVLVYCPQFDNIYRVFREGDAWHQFSTSDVLMQAVTHWRPLPKAPESEGE